MSFSITSGENNPKVGIISTLADPECSAIIFCAALLSERSVQLKNHPDINNIRNLLKALKDLAYSYHYYNNTLEINPPAIPPTTFDAGQLFQKAPPSLCLYLIPVFLNYSDNTRVPWESGFHFGVKQESIALLLNLFGYRTSTQDNVLEIRKNNIRSCDIDLNNLGLSDPDELSKLSILALLLAASISNHTINIHNPLGSSILDHLCDFLKCAGFKILQTSNSISLRRSNSSKNISFKIPPCPQGVMAHICAAKFLNFPLILRNTPDVTINTLSEEISLLEHMDVQVVKETNSLYIPISESISPLDINISDIQLSDVEHWLFIALILNRAPHCSYFHHWPMGLSHIMEWNKLGFRFEIGERILRINPTMPFLAGQTVNCVSLSDTITTMLAGMMAPGTTTIHTSSLSTDFCKNMYKDIAGFGINSFFTPCEA